MITASMLTSSVSFAFTPAAIHHRLRTQLNGDPGPPLNWGQASTPDPTPIPDANVNPNQPMDASSEGEEGSLKANKFSIFAPDADLSKEDFVSELKENMKRDLERRRSEDPNRGNQPAKHYLDSL